MNITASLDLPVSDRAMLAHIIGCDPNDLEASLAPHASAAIKEYASMFLGKNVYTRGADMQEFRLLLLIENAFNNQIPSEQDVCKLFQLTAAAARSLIKAVISKYQYRLKPAIETTLSQLVDSACVDASDSSITLSVYSLNLVEQMNRELAEIDTSLPPVKKKTGTNSTYELRASSYSRLCTRFDVTNKIPQS